MKAVVEYRVPVADTDMLGIVYYANYLKYFEMARAELLRQAGFSYTALEAGGFSLPVTEAHCTYKHPAKFEDLLIISAEMTEAKGVRVRISCEVYCSDTLLAEGYTVHPFINRTTMRPSKPPQDIIDALRK